MTQRIKPRPRGRPHEFIPDPDTPGDPLQANGVCLTCHLPGRAGDAHHDPPEPVADARELAAHDE